MLTGRKYRMYPNENQAFVLFSYGGIDRFLWNSALEQRRQARRKGLWVNYKEQAADLVQAKKAEGLEFLKALPSQVAQQTLMDLEAACARHGTWKVKFKSRSKAKPSFRFPDAKNLDVKRLNKKWAQVRLPKLGWVRFRLHRAIGGQLRSATVTWSGTQWNIAFLIEDGLSTPEEHERPTTTVGVDRGIKIAAALSTGHLLERDFITTGEAARYRRLQQALSRSMKGSKNREKIKARIRANMARVVARRKDFWAKIACRLATCYGRVVLEDLNTAKMTKRAKEKNVAQKSGLNRAILDKGWYQCELALTSKARYTGTIVVKVPAAYTSQRCFECKHVTQANRESQAVFACVNCGHEAHADVNAALNVNHAAGPAVSACGDFGVTQSVKQESVGDRKVNPQSSSNTRPATTAV